MNWTLTPDQFALAWTRSDGDRIPYPLAVRTSARDSAERAARLPALNQWCDKVLDADLTAALHMLAAPTVAVAATGQQVDPPAGQREVMSGFSPAIGRVSAAPTVRPIRILGAVNGRYSVVAAQRAGAAPDRGGDISLFVGSANNLPGQIVSSLPRHAAGSATRLTAPLSRVRENSRDLVTVSVAGPTKPDQIRTLLQRPRSGIGQIVVSVRHDDELQPFGVLCWIDVAADGRYAVRTGADVDIVPVDAPAFAAQLRPMVTAAERSLTTVPAAPTVPAVGVW